MTSAKQVKWRTDVYKHECLVVCNYIFMITGKQDNKYIK